MAAQNMSRKRPAPGTEPVGYPQNMQQSAGSYDPALGPQLSNDEFLQWGQAPAQPQNAYQDQSNFNVAVSQYPSNNAAVSNQLARFPMNQMVPRTNPNGNQWMQDPNAAAAANDAWEDNVDELEQKAQAAKRDAVAKRKQIPPFVSKLRFFVEDEKNNDLIRWTEDGKSFVVLDEDEFAKKLIPELFKHNNYASFVRQLNMYGFHKKVGLSDNSMRASERKAKSPSEYSNPYFRRGHPDLMYLIQKPKNVTAGTKGKARTKAEEDNAEDGEEVNEEVVPEGRVRPRPQLTLGDGSTDSLALETLQNVQRELQLIRRQQAQISQMMGALKREHEQLYGQAVNFQDQHTRHENSINAILTFLATIYNRSLSGNDTAQSIANMFSGSLPQDGNKSGTVVDVGDYNFNQFPGMEDLGNKPFKKPQLLLTDGQNRATTMSPGSSSSPVVRPSRGPSQKPPTSPQVQEVFDHVHDANQAAFNRNARANGNQRNQRNQDMMSMIESANARNPGATTPVADFTNALNDLENSQGNSPLSNAQRENVLRMMNTRANQGGDNALVNSNPPTGPSNFDRHLASTKADMDTLARMQAQQDQSVEKLTNLLQPLSPSGSIPGIHDGQPLPGPPLDIDDFLSHNEYFADFPSDGAGNVDFSSANRATGANDNSNAFNWDPTSAADDDELFADVDNKYNNTATNNYGKDWTTSNVKNEYDDSSSNYLNVGGGHVESVASSEVTTPKHASVSGDEDIANMATTRAKGRKLSTLEEQANKKRRRS